MTQEDVAFLMMGIVIGMILSFLLAVAVAIYKGEL